MTCISPSVAAPANRRGFTLIEMLTVITIITILAGVSVSMIGTIKEGSKLTKCSTNLQLISQGIMGYANDWKGALPSMSQMKGENVGFAQYLNYRDQNVTDVSNITDVNLQS